MEHLFTSGESMYKKNEKELAEGVFSGDFLEYSDILPETEFMCIGKLDGREARIKFIVSEDDFEAIQNRYSLKILMQSDILQAKWKRYEIADSE